MNSRKQVQEIFGRASELAPSERQGYLDQACGNNDVLRREVEGLLADLDAAGDFLEAPFPDPGLSPRSRQLGSDVGRTIGDYVLIRPIGGGGMGHVYLAERVDDEFHQQVAVKLLRSERQEFLARFKREREVLASLEHPHIARLYGGGTQEGRPYLVMEYVEGKRIDAFCEGRAVRERVQLLLKVCRAVAYAHGRLVVHRDIKPSNILVTEESEPKLLDFGIAKPLQAGPSLTRGQAPMTLRYASPEQITDELVTTATDVYGLGLLLFRLLTGGLPYSIRSENSVEVARAIVEDEPARPSARGVPEAAGDLDAIVLKALRKEPSDRYPSVEAFSKELERYLEGLPVQARGTDGWYRVRKLARRYRWPLAAAGVVVLLVAAFVLALVRSEARAAHEANKARQALRGFVDVFKGSDPEFARGREITAREILDGGADTVREIEDPDVRATLLSTMGEVYTSLGLFDRAESLLAEVLDLRRDLGPRLHAEGLYQLAELAYYRRQYAEAEALYRDALEQLPDRHGLEHGRIVRGLGIVMATLNPNGDGEVVLRDALAELEQHFDRDHPEILRLIEGLGRAARDRGDYVAAAEHFGEVVTVLRRGGPGPALARSLADLGDVLYRQGQLQEARSLHEEALPVLRQSMGADNTYVAEVLGKLVAVLGRLGDDTAAEKAIREILEILPEGHPGRGTTLHNLAMILINRGELEEAAWVAKQALVLQRRAFGEEHENVALSLCLLGRIALRKGKPSLARSHYESCARMYPPDHPRLVFPWVGIGRSVELSQGCATAVDWYQRALTLGKEKLGEKHFQTTEAARYLEACSGNQ